MTAAVTLGDRLVEVLLLRRHDELLIICLQCHELGEWLGDIHALSNFLTALHIVRFSLNAFADEPAKLLGIDLAGARTAIK